MISEIIEKIKNFIKKLTKKDLYLDPGNIEKTSTTKSDVVEENDFVELPKSNFVENTYEVNSWQKRIEEGTVRVEDISLELKLKIIEEYNKQIARLEQEVEIAQKKLEIVNN